MLLVLLSTAFILCKLHRASPLFFTERPSSELILSSRHPHPMSISQQRPPINSSSNRNLNPMETKAKKLLFLSPALALNWLIIGKREWKDSRRSLSYWLIVISCFEIVFISFGAVFFCFVFHKYDLSLFIILPSLPSLFNRLFCFFCVIVPVVILRKERLVYADGFNGCD